MSISIPKFERSAIVRGKEAESVGTPDVQVRLLADSSATGGALSTVRVSLKAGADGAKPHTHKKSAEMFYVLDGRLDILSGDQITKAEVRDVIVVPPRMPHAFAAERDSGADILIINAPGVERFEYFRPLTRIARGEQRPESLQAVQDLYDNYFFEQPSLGRRTEMTAGKGQPRYARPIQTPVTGDEYADDQNIERGKHSVSPGVPAPIGS